MKRFLTLASTLSFLLIAFTSTAQIELDCKGSQNYDWEGTADCFAHSDTMTKDEAVALVTEAILKKANVICKNTCLLGSRDCEPLIDYWRSVKSVYKNDAGMWCHKAKISVKVACSDCQDTSKLTIYPVLLNLGGGDINEALEETANIESAKAAGKVAHVMNSYPNPSSGEVNLEVALFESNSSVRLILKDIAGNVQYQQQYKDLAQDFFQPRLDFSNLSNGLYFLSVEVNGQLINTNKLTIQH